ncbi:MAG: PAS domain S-box protein [Nitrospiraceae bacterium]
MSHWVGEEFENNSQPMCAVDRQTLVFLSVNEAAVHRLGFSADEFSAMTLKDILGSEEAMGIVQACVKAPSTKLPLRIGPFMLRKKDGTVMASEIHCQSIPLDGKDAIFMLVAKPRLRGPHKTSESSV